MSGAARRARRVALGLGVVAAIAGLGVVAVYLRSEAVLTRRHAVPSGPERPDVAVVPAVAPEIAASRLERGRHLVTVVAQCTFCHGPDLAGREIADDPWIGRLHASNLTRGQGGIGRRYRDIDWVGALRHGVAPDGRTLLLMPSAGLTRLSDEDLAAIVAYLRQIPAVDRIQPEKRTGWLTRLVVATGLAPDLLSAEQVSAGPGTVGATSRLRGAAERGVETVARSATGPGEESASRAAPEPGPTAAYGEYLVALGSCRVCHRADLAGGLHPLSLPGEPVPPDLTPRGPLRDWTGRDFERAMRAGRTPEGRVLDREYMPWPTFAGLEEGELEAIWAYLRSLGEDGAGGQASEPTDLAAGQDVDRSRS
jgi:mono/diheme cytochrome c family protein